MEPSPISVQKKIITKGSIIMSDLSLLMTFSLVLLSMYLSYRNRLGLEKDLIIGSIRAVVQLTCIGFVLTYIFEWNNNILTTLILLIMVYNAANVASKHGQGIENTMKISFFTLCIGLFVTLGSLLLFGSIKYAPNEVIPIGGMILGNSMIALGLIFKGLKENFNRQSDEVEIKLCLGARPRQAAAGILRETMKTAMLPTIDSMKTVGIVQLPGMMTGLILAGVSPAIAIKYQIMVAFMLVGAVSITALLASCWTYKKFFTRLEQLRRL